MKKDKQYYTTVQIKKEINTHIRDFCKENGLVASSVTEMLWAKYISSSVSGSLVL